MDLGKENQALKWGQRLCVVMWDKEPGLAWTSHGKQGKGT